MDNSKQYPLGNKAKDLLIYSYKVTKPIGERRLNAEETLHTYEKIAAMQTFEERQNAVKSAAASMKKRKRQGFPKSAVHTYIRDIRRITLNILRGVHSANDCDGKTETGKRIDILKNIIDDCGVLLVLVEISHDLGYIDSSRLKHWTSLICDVKFITMAWRKKEKFRLGGG